MESSSHRLTPTDRLYLQRAYELAARGAGNTSPNPPAGAVIVQHGRIVGEGYHHRAGEPHAEPNALAQAGEAARGATVYVSLEPCDHVGRTPPCTQALLGAGVARVVAGTADPTGHGNLARLRRHGVEVTIAGDAAAASLIEIFAGSALIGRPCVALKMAMSLDGAITSQPGVQEWITSDAERLYVRELRVAYDAVMVGAGTVRVDDPQLTVRPPRRRLRPFVRVVVCETETLAESSRIFAEVQEYAKTIVLVPAGLSERFANLRDVAEVLLVGGGQEQQIDLAQAMRVLRERGISSVLCEGGPTLGARLIAGGLVDRLYWAIAPTLLTNARSVPVLAGANLAELHLHLRFDRIQRIGEDVILSATPSLPHCHPEPVEG